MKIFENYRRCKFNPCAYRHENDSSKTNDEVEERKVKEIHDKLSVIENEINKKNEQIEAEQQSRKIRPTKENNRQLKRLEIDFPGPHVARGLNLD